MKYTIETTNNGYGCIETLEFSNGEKYTKQTTRTFGGCRQDDDDFSEQLERNGFCNEIVEKVYDNYDSFGALNFLELAEFED